MPKIASETIGSYNWADNVLTRFEVVLDGVDA